MNYVDNLIYAICKDIDIRQSYLQYKTINTIYFGGGTPSILTKDQILLILNKIKEYFKLADDYEMTFECNPDDLSIGYLEDLKDLGINRLSIGVQSFFEEDLVFMNRSHTSSQSETSINNAQKIGFQNITIDLIYGSPTTTDEMWYLNIQKAIEFQINHISSYALTIEEKTAFGRWVQTGKMNNPDENKAESQFNILINELENNGYLHYEISNFGRPNNIAKHNTNYWKGIPYLGIGPSAHSFDGESRSWCVSHNHYYIDGVMNDKPYMEQEDLSFNEKWNEYIMTGLRTMWGVDLTEIENRFGENEAAIFLKQIEDAEVKDLLIRNDKTIILTKQGKLFADRIASYFFRV